MGLDLDPTLVAELNRRAGKPPPSADFAVRYAYASQKTKSAIVGNVGDAVDFDLEETFGLVLAPMQLIQLLDGAAERVRCLRCAAKCLRQNGMVAVAIVDGSPTARAEESVPPTPDVREVNGWIYSSLPLETMVDGNSLVVRRLRQTVSPGGELSEEVNEIKLRALTAERLEAEARAVGLRPAGRREIPATDTHVGSTVVLLEKEGL